MEKYSISDLEQLSGIKAHTLRIWEKRYGIIAPHRTATNIRYYDADHLKKLLNVASLLSDGFKISAVAQMSPAAMKAELLRNSGQTGKFHAELVKAMTDFNAPVFEQIVDDAMEKMGVAACVNDLLYPFLQQTGLLWSVSVVSAVQEHFASSIIKRKLMVQIDKLPQPKRRKKFLLFLPAGEWHDLGLLLAEYLIRRADCKVINFGQNVPQQELFYAIEKIRPNYLFTLLIGNGHDAQIAAMQSFITDGAHPVTLALSGATERLKRVAPSDNTVILENPNSILKLLD